MEPGQPSGVYGALVRVASPPPPPVSQRKVCKSTDAKTKTFHKQTNLLSMAYGDSFFYVNSLHLLPSKFINVNVNPVCPIGQPVSGTGGKL